MRLRPLIACALVTAFSGTALASQADAQILPDIALPTPQGIQLPIPDGLKFQPEAVPNLERDCGETATSSPAIPADPKGTNPKSANPLAGDHFFVDPTERAYKDMLDYRARGDQKDADAMSRLALQPVAHWFGRFTQPDPVRKIRNYINCVQRFQPGATPLMMVMRHQGKECNPHYQAGGPAEDALTRQWYDQFAEAVGDSRVVIGFEPDSIGTISCLAKSRRQSRRDNLRYGVDVLSKLPNATIYLEATASDWKSPKYTAGMLRYMGIQKVRGFMLNVTHHDWTANNVAYGRKVSRMVGGKPFVISTAYNGRGPVHYKLGKAGRYRRVNVYCNPSYRGLGPAPTTSTGIAGVDAFLYLNRPGVSGAGPCNGGPHIGDWWPSRALMYARYATNWLAPPRGTSNGLPFKVSRCRLGAPIKGENTYSDVAPQNRCR